MGLSGIAGKGLASAGGGGIVNGLGETIFSQTVDDELIDWANKIDIPVPSWAKKVEIACEPKSGQSGADTSLRARFNNDDGANYYFQRSLQTDSTIVGSEAGGNTFVTLGIQLTSANRHSLGVATIFPKNYGKHRQALITYNFDNGVNTFKGDEYRTWQNIVDDVAAIQVYTADSTKASCVITVRAWS